VRLRQWLGRAQVGHVAALPLQRRGRPASAFLSGDSSGSNIAHHVVVRVTDAGINICDNILLNAMLKGKCALGPFLSILVI
jgi:hypothetical protein